MLLRSGLRGLAAPLAAALVAGACASNVELGGQAGGTTGSGGAGAATSASSTGQTSTSGGGMGGGGAGGASSASSSGASSSSSASSSSGGPECSPMQPCAAGLSCCNDVCIDLANDVAHCGACDAPCVAPFQAMIACSGAMCVMTGCEANYADCNGNSNDGCEQNTLVDGDCFCAPGMIGPCYQGAPGTEGVGPCHAGTHVCDASGLMWGPCQGQVMPVAEVCANNVDDDCNDVVDDVFDHDGDGWTACEGDCCEWVGPNCPVPKHVNPGAFETLLDGIDNDCDPSTPDVGPPSCDPGPIFAQVTPHDIAWAMDLCQSAAPSPPKPQKTWGLLDATFLLADGSAPSAAQLADIESWQTAVLPSFGDVITPHVGTTMAGLSTGRMRDAGDAGFASPAPGTDFGSVSTLPASYLAAHNGAIPGLSLCGGSCPGGAGAYDSVRVRLTLRAPTNKQSFSYDLRYFSIEYGARPCSPYNDGFVALLQSAAVGLPIDHNISYDALANPLLANNAFFSSCVPQGCYTCPAGTAELAGTGMELGGDSGWLTTDAPMVPGETFQLDLLIFDVSDGEGDTHVLLDNFRWNGPPGSITMP